MEIRIALNNQDGVYAGMPSEHQNAGYISEKSRFDLAALTKFMPNRDADVTTQDEIRHGSVKSWRVKTNPDNGRHELVIEIDI
jgi:hypothetical protein